jgi:Ca2+-binding RTX toxin-like protein
MLRRGRVIVGLGACAAAAAASLAHGFIPPTGVYATGGTHSVSIDGSAQDNRVSVGYSADSRYVIHDPSGAVGGCAQVDPQTVSCPGTALEVSYLANGGADTVMFALPVAASITAWGGDPPPSLKGRGSDRFAIAAGSPARARFSGYLSGDVLIGGADYDYLSGGRGSDRLVGRAGDDRLLGAQGSDRFVGGLGDDKVQAASNDRDESVRCGAGEDVALIDRGEDPPPRGCEVVRYR